jgi:1-acyl-sn-glycerol-3-phosphate acyltransferase
MLNTLRQWGGSVAFTSLLFLTVPVYAAAAFLVAPFGRAKSYRIAVAWSASILFLLRVLCRLDYRVDGGEHIGNESSVVLLKHSSSWETIAQMVIFPRQTWVMKRELRWVPILGWVLRLFEPIAIDRRGGRVAVEQVLAQGRARLDRGLWVMVFPEGTRVPVGAARRYGISGALLAELTGRPIIPVAHNAGVFWPRRAWLKRPGTISVAIGAPIDTAGRDARSVIAEVQRWIDDRLAAFDPPA